MQRKLLVRGDSHFTWHSYEMTPRLGVKFHPRYLPWHLPVFTGLENTPQVANTGKLNFFLP